MKEQMFSLLEKKFFVNGVQFDESALQAKQLKEEDIMKQLIARRAAEFEATDIRIGGTNMMKWLGHFFAAHIYFYSTENKWLTYDDFSFVEKGKDAQIHLFRPSFEDINEQSFKERLEKLLISLRPIIECIASTSGLPVRQVWGLLTNPFYRGYEKWLKEATNNDQIDRFQLDLQTIKGMSTECLGLTYNPFNIRLRYVDHWNGSGDKIRIKAACCMSDLKPSGKKCYSCPQVTEDQRAERGRELFERNA